MVSTWKTVVVGVDGSPPSHKALTWAAAEAADHRADLLVVNVWEHTLPPATGSASVSEHSVPDPGQRTAEDLLREIKEVLGDDPPVLVQPLSSTVSQQRCSSSSRRTPTCSWSVRVATADSGAWCWAR